MGGSVSVDGARGIVPESIAFESFDVRIRVDADSLDVLERIPALLPPHAVACSPATASVSFAIVSQRNGSYNVERDGSDMVRDIDLDFALMFLEAQMTISVGMNTPGRIFVHSGAVEHGSVAIVAPGFSFAGKTTLVAALARAGARYLSDEYAVIDEAGLVHPFAKPLSIRDHNQVQSDHDVQALGGRLAPEPVPIGAVVFTEYRPGAEWRPERLTPGRGVLEMLVHTLPLEERHEEALPVLRNAIDGAVLLKGERGEAAELVEPLLAMVRGASARGRLGAAR